MNSSKNFILLACVALRQGNTDDAAQLFSHAAVMKDFDEFLSSELSGNYEAVHLASSLSSPFEKEKEFEGLASGFREALSKAFGNSLSSDDADYGLSIEDDSDDKDDEDDEDDFSDDDFESDSSVQARYSSPLRLNL